MAFKSIPPFLLTAAVMAFGGCATLESRHTGRPVLPPPGLVINWTSLRPGLEYAAVLLPDPPAAVYALRVDLSFPGLEFFVTPGNGETPLDTDALRTTTFLERHELIAAVNGSPYHPYLDEEGQAADVVGLHVSEGRIVSPGEGRYGAVLFYDNRYIEIQRPPFDLSGVRHALGGFHIILSRGINLGGSRARDARTAYGLSADGRRFYILVADGRSGRRALGLTTGETAEWLRFLGASEGLNMDGGGSSTLAIRGDGGEAVLLNRPRNRFGLPEVRPAANHLGIR
jgi:hypothetical protein